LVIYKTKPLAMHYPKLLISIFPRYETCCNARPNTEINKEIKKISY